MIANLDEIKSQLDAWQVLQTIGYVKSNPQRSSASEVRDFCPVHKSDNQRSLSINTITGLGNCHSCGFEGDLIGLYMKSMDVAFDKAVTVLAATTGTEVNYKAATPTNMPAAKRTPQQVLDESSLSGQHPYLDKKCVDACEGLYFGNDERGNPAVIVPFYNVDGELQTVQFVHDGKYFLGGYPTSGSFFSSRKFSDGETVYLAEGIATALMNWMALGKSTPVVSFGSANNLTHVVKALTQKYPHLKIIICLDYNESALKQVRKLENPSAYSYRLPCFDGLSSNTTGKDLADFNDLVSKCDQSLSVVKDQLDVVLSFSDLPTGQISDRGVTEAHKADVKLSSFNNESQEEVLSYLLKKPFDRVIEEGLDPENFESRIFSPKYKPILEGIRKTWEQGLLTSLTQVAINSHDNSPELYEALHRIEHLPLITAKQVEERLVLISQHHAQSTFNALVAEIQSSDKAPHEKVDSLRKQLDGIQGSFEAMLPQSHYLHRIVDDIKNPKQEILTTGIRSLDRLIGGGFKKAEFGILAGGAGSGKTAFALQITDNVAGLGGIVIYVSVEVGVNKLTERSFKRLSYVKSANSATSTIDHGISVYQQLADNIYLKKGHHGMQVSEIRGMALSVMRQRKTNNILLIVDPFQRLGTGDKKVDSNNETLKVGTLCSQLKELAESLNIPILALSDTVKDHKNNKSGEGSIRGSYMGDHTADYVMMLRTSRLPMMAMYGENKESDDEDPFLKGIKTVLESSKFKEQHKLNGPFDKYASLVTSKVRDGAKYSPLFIYRPAHHLFEDTSLWDNILPKEQDK